MHAAAQHVWKMVKEACLDCLENTFGVICSYCGSNDNPSVGQFVGVLKTSIISGLAFRGLCGTDYEDDGQSTFLGESHVSAPVPSI
jgi:hypothetical protein